MRTQRRRGRSRTSIGATRSPEARAAILAAARELLAEEGYRSFSIDEVARRAGAGKPTIYRWWPSKADLFIEVYSAEKSATIPVPDTGAFSSDLVAYTRDLWRFWRDTPSGRTFRALVAEAQGSEAALAVLRTKFLPERTQAVRRILDRAAARGEIEVGDIDLLLELYLGFNWYRSLTGRIDDDRQGIANMAAFLAAPRAGSKNSLPGKNPSL